MDVLDRLATRAHTARTLLSAGFVRPEPPGTALRSVRALRRWGPTLAAGVTPSAIRQPDRVAVVDELGSLTWREVHERSNAIAWGLAGAGVGEGDGVAIMCRNHRGFVDATLACMKPRWLRHMIATPSPSPTPARARPPAIAFERSWTSRQVSGPSSSTTATRSGWRIAEVVTPAASVGPQRRSARTDRTAVPGGSGRMKPAASRVRAVWARVARRSRTSTPSSQAESIALSLEVSPRRRSPRP